MKNLELTAARCVLGVATKEDVLQVANRALDKGLYSESLAELATSIDLRLPESVSLFQKAIRELDYIWPSHDVAVLQLVLNLLVAIFEGRILPREGVRILINEVLSPSGAMSGDGGYVGSKFGLEKIIGAFSAYEDVEADPESVSYEGLFGQDALRKIDEDIIRFSYDWVQRTK